MGGKRGAGAAEGEGVGRVWELELWEARIEAAPAAGEDAGPRSGRGGQEAMEDEEEHIVGERVEKILVGPAWGERWPGREARRPCNGGRAMRPAW